MLFSLSSSPATHCLLLVVTLPEAHRFKLRLTFSQLWMPGPPPGCYFYLSSLAWWLHIHIRLGTSLPTHPGPQNLPLVYCPISSSPHLQEHGQFNSSDRDEPGQAHATTQIVSPQSAAQLLEPSYTYISTLSLTQTHLWLVRVLVTSQLCNAFIECISFSRIRFYHILFLSHGVTPTPPYNHGQSGSFKGDWGTAVIRPFILTQIKPDRPRRRDCKKASE